MYQAYLEASLLEVRWWAGLILEELAAAWSDVEARLATPNGHCSFKWHQPAHFQVVREGFLKPAAHGTPHHRMAVFDYDRARADPLDAAAGVHVTNIVSLQVAQRM